MTRSNQWVRITPYLELLDTPGLLWPNLSDQQDARALAFVGTINVTHGSADARHPPDGTPDGGSCRRAGNPLQAQGSYPARRAALEEACRGRGWLLPGGVCDTDRGAAIILDEFRAGKLGRITLQKAPAKPQNMEAQP